MSLTEESTGNNSNSVTFLYHGSCGQCHRLHIAKPITIRRDCADQVTRYPCENCGKLLFGIGGQAARLSLASRLTTSSWNLARPSRMSSPTLRPPVGLGITEVGLEQRRDSGVSLSPRRAEEDGPALAAVLVPVQPEEKPKRGARSKLVKLFKRIPKAHKPKKMEKLFNWMRKSSPIAVRDREGSTGGSIHPTWPLQCQTSRDAGGPVPNTVAANPTQGVPIAPAPIQTSDASAAVGTELPASGRSTPTLQPRSSEDQRLQDYRRELTLQYEARKRLVCRCRHECDCISTSAIPSTSPEQNVPVSRPSRHGSGATSCGGSTRCSSPRISIGDPDFYFRGIGGQFETYVEAPAEAPRFLQSHFSSDSDSNTIGLTGSHTSNPRASSLPLPRRAYSLPTAPFRRLF